MHDLHTFDQIGKLVLALRWVDEPQLRAALTYAQEANLPLGLALIKQRRLTVNELRALVDAQSRVRDGVLHPVIAIMALTLVSWSTVTLETALSFLGIKDENSAAYSNKLGALLLKSNCVKEEQLSAGLELNRVTGLPLGQILLLRGLVTANCLSLALNLQALVREGTMSKNEAIAGLTLTHRRARIARRERSVAMAFPELRLGELLVLADVVSRDDIKLALEAADVNSRRLGEVLSIFALVPGRILTTALELQRMQRKGEITLDQAVCALADANTSGVPIKESLDRNRKNNGDLARPVIAELFQSIGAWTDRDIRTIGAKIFEYPRLLAQACDVPGGEFALRNATRLKYLVEKKHLTIEAACFAFNHCMAHNTDVDQFLKQTGWYQQVEPGSNVYQSASGIVAVL